MAFEKKGMRDWVEDRKSTKDKAIADRSPVDLTPRTYDAPDVLDKQAKAYAIEAYKNADRKLSLDEGARVATVYNQYRPGVAFNDSKTPLVVSKEGAEYKVELLTQDDMGALIIDPRIEDEVRDKAKGGWLGKRTEVNIDGVAYKIDYAGDEISAISIDQYSLPKNLPQELNYEIAEAPLDVTIPEALDHAAEAYARLESASGELSENTRLFTIYRHRKLGPDAHVPLIVTKDSDVGGFSVQQADPRIIEDGTISIDPDLETDLEKDYALRERTGLWSGVWNKEGRRYNAFERDGVVYVKEEDGDFTIIHLPAVNEDLIEAQNTHAHKSIGPKDDGIYGAFPGGEEFEKQGELVTDPVARKHAIEAYARAEAELQTNPDENIIPRGGVLTSYDPRGLFNRTSLVVTKKPDGSYEVRQVNRDTADLSNVMVDPKVQDEIRDKAKSWSYKKDEYKLDGITYKLDWDDQRNIRGIEPVKVPKMTDDLATDIGYGLSPIFGRAAGGADAGKTGLSAEFSEPASERAALPKIPDALQATIATSLGVPASGNVLPKPEVNPEQSFSA